MLTRLRTAASGERSAVRQPSWDRLQVGDRLDERIKRLPSLSGRHPHEAANDSRQYPFTSEREISNAAAPIEISSG